MKTQFELESEMMNCWNVVDDIRTLYESFDRKELTQDDIQNVLLGLMTLYQMKFEKLQSVYEKMLREKCC